MEGPDPDRSRSRRLKFTKTDFDDYLIALMVKLRLNATADRIISGELQHPLVDFQQQNSVY